MKVTVRNRKKGIVIEYDNAYGINGFVNMFIITLEDMSRATYDYIDEEDGSEWEYDCYIKLRRC